MRKFKGGVDNASTRSFKKYEQVIQNFLFARDLNRLASSYYNPYLNDDDFTLQIGKFTYGIYNGNIYGDYMNYLRYAEQQGKPLYYTMLIFLKTEKNIVSKFEMKSFIEKYLIDKLYNKAKHFYIGHLHLKNRLGKTYENEYSYVEDNGFVYTKGYVHMYYIVIFDNYVLYISYDISTSQLDIKLHMLPNLLTTYKDDFQLSKIGYVENDMTWDDIDVDFYKFMMLLNNNNRGTKTTKWSLADIDYDVLIQIAKNLHAYKTTTNEKIEINLKSAIQLYETKQVSSRQVTKIKQNSHNLSTTQVITSSRQATVSPRASIARSPVSPRASIARSPVSPRAPRASIARSPVSPRAPRAPRARSPVSPVSPRASRARSPVSPVSPRASRATRSP